MTDDKKLKVQKVKGRAMLYWVGKKPIDTVQVYPAQLVETVGSAKPLEMPTYDALKDDWSNLLFHGDNKEVLSTLLVNGFRGKVDLIYIDPPFDSKADYVRKVELRGTSEKLEGEGQTAIEQVQYQDIWANDTYLQFMYERLILLRELLSDQGSIYLHCDWHKSHLLRSLMDEVFGSDNCLNEIIWAYGERETSKGFYNRKHDNIFLYAKNKTANYIFNASDAAGEYSAVTVAKFKYVDEDGRKYRLRYKDGRSDPAEESEDTYRQYLEEQKGTLPRDWIMLPILNQAANERGDYPTQKPEALLEQFVKVSSNRESIVLDCFIGSGTTAAAAQELGRRWIGADINKGAIQTTMKRLQRGESRPSLLHYRVNNYDFQQISALRAMIIEKYGITESKTDMFFDGIVGGRLVKIAELNRPITKLDVQDIMSELKNRPDETRDILLIGSGKELGADDMLHDNMRLQGSVNHIEVKDIQTDGIIVAEPAEADVAVEKAAGKVKVKIKSYLSPTIIRRLDIDRSIFGERIKDFRAQIDTVLIDTDYDGKTFRVVHADVPERKQDFVVGEYELDLPQSSKRVAVKITDMLGEETLIVG